MATKRKERLTFRICETPSQSSRAEVDFHEIDAHKGKLGQRRGHSFVEIYKYIIINKLLLKFSEKILVFPKKI